MRNVDGFFSKERPIKHIMEINIYYQRHRERIEIDVIEKQKWSIILDILWFACYDLKIDWRTGEVKMIRYPEERVK